MEHRTWIFPSPIDVHIACTASAGVKLAYYAARRRIEECPTQFACDVTEGVLHGQATLTLRWEAGIDQRLPAIVDAIALLPGGTPHAGDGAMQQTQGEDATL